MKVKKKTITSIFMIPSLNIPNDSLKENGFINAYEEDAERDFQYLNSVYLLFLPKDIVNFREFLDGEYERTEQIIEDYDYQNGFVVVVYKLNSEWDDQFDLIRKGRYSKTSKNFQQLFKKVVKLKKNGLHRDEISLQYRIFNKTEDMIEYWKNKIGIEWNDDLEVWEGYDREKEILCINEIKNELKLIKQ